MDEVGGRGMKKLIMTWLLAMVLGGCTLNIYRTTVMVEGESNVTDVSQEIGGCHEGMD